jgi:hypothetical protein
MQFRCPASTPGAGLEGITAISRRMRATRRPDAAWQRRSGVPHAAPDVAWEPADRSQPRWARNVFVRNAELLQRLAWTMLLAMLMRAGCFVPLPDIARASLPTASGGHCAEHRSLLQLNDFLSCHHSASTLSCYWKPAPMWAQQNVTAAGLADQLLHTAKELPASLFEVGFAPYFVVSIFMALAVANAKSLGSSLPILHHWREGGSLVSLYTQPSTRSIGMLMHCPGCPLAGCNIRQASTGF